MPTQFSNTLSFRKARRARMRTAWSVWCVAMVFVLFQFFLQLSSGEVINGLIKSFTLTAFTGGILASSYYYVYVLLQIPAGLLLDRYGPRGLLSGGALVVAIGCTVFSFAKTIDIALIGRIMMGGGSAFAFVGCLNIISIWFPKRKFALMAAIVETAGMAGAIFGNFWLAQVIQKMGWRNAMSIAGIFAAILSCFLWIIVRNARNKKRKSLYEAADTEIYRQLKKLLANKMIWLNGAFSGVMFSIVTVFAALWAIPFFEISHQVNLVQSTLTASCLYAGVGIGGPIMGWLDGKTSWRKPMMVSTAIFSGGFLTLSIYCIAAPLWVIGLLLFFSGMCASSYMLTFAIANDFATHTNRATLMGLTNMICVLFAPIFQPMVGFLMTLFDKLHTTTAAQEIPTAVMHFQWAISIVPLLALAAALMACWLPGRKSPAKYMSSQPV